MNRIKQIFNGALLSVVLLGCQEDAPNPALPDISGLGDPNPITGFLVASPASGLSLNIKPSTAVVEIDWEDTEAVDSKAPAVTYEWLADEADGDFSAPLLTIVSDNEGKDSHLTLTHTELYDALGDAGVAAGAKLSLKWTVRAKSGSNTRLATTPRLITVQRGGFTFKVYVPANTPAELDVYLAGQFGFLGAGGDWQQPGSNTALKLTRNDDGTHSITLGIPAGTSIEYKYFLATSAAPDWSKGEQKPNDDGTGTQGLDNRRLTVDGSFDNYTEVVNIWEGYSFPYLAFRTEVPANTPATQEIFMAGELANIGGADGNWQQPGTNGRLKLTPYGDGSYFIVFPAPSDGSSLQYKYFLASTNAPAWNGGEQSRNAPNDCSGLSNRTFTYDGSVTVVKNTVQVWEGHCF